MGNKTKRARITEEANESFADSAGIHCRSLKLKNKAFSFDDFFNLFLAIPGLDIIFEIDQIEVHLIEH